MGLETDQTALVLAFLILYDLIATAPSSLTLHSPSQLTTGTDPTPEILVSGVEPLARSSDFIVIVLVQSVQVLLFRYLDGSSSVIVEATPLTDE